MNDWKKEINKNSALQKEDKKSEETKPYSGLIGKLKYYSSRKKLEELYLNNALASRLIILIGLSFIITYLVYPSQQLSYHALQVGDIAPETIKANRNYIIVDRKTTELKKREAADSTPLSFYFDPTIKKELLKNIDKAFRQMRNSKTSDDPNRLRLFNNILGIDLSKKHFEILDKLHFNRTIQKILTQIVKKVISQYVTIDKEVLFKTTLPTILLLSLDAPSQELPQIVQTSLINDLQMIREQIYVWGQENKNAPSVDKMIQTIIVSIAQRVIRPNLKFNEEGTEEAKNEAMSSIKEATISIQKGEVLIRQGDRIDTNDLTIIEGLHEATRSRMRGILFFGVFLFHIVFIFIAYYFAINYFKDFKPSFKDLILLSTVLIMTIVMVDTFQFLSNLVHEVFSQISLDAFNFIIPIFASGMLIALVLNFEVAFFYAIILSIILGLASEYSTILSERGIYYSFYCFCGSLIGIKGTYKSDQRISIFKAGIILGLFNTVIVIILTFLESKLFLISTLSDYLYPMAMAFSSGVLSSIIVLGITPVVELFGYTTDIKLLELANTDHPLLSKLAIEAPGTYHHSFVVSRLAESAAEAIGVNSLLVKVACLYHDIGKVLKPSYFIENQEGRENKHDKLSPHMSSMIIQSHVKEGIELAKKAKLPKVIIDLIPQHHGTSLISYFYNKARKMENKEVEAVDAQDYRYTGPRPQSKEGAIIMLADSIEATARSLEEPTPGKLKEVVDTTITKRFKDGQLDECNLTFNDLNIIAENFTNTLIKSIYHPRISYILEEKQKELKTVELNKTLGVDAIKKALDDEKD